MNYDPNKSTASVPLGGTPTPRPFEAGTTNAIDSLAVTFKRLVDMLEPFAKVAAEQLAQEAADAKKGKGK